MRKVFITLTGIILLVCMYFMYVKYSAEQYEKERKAWLQNLKHTASKNVTIIEQAININKSQPNRTIAVYLPEGYETDTISYPVFYFLDGQSIFDNKILQGDEWQVDEVLDSLSTLNQKAIAVGIYNSDLRDTEYQPDFSPNKNDKRFTGNVHSEWVVSKVKPWIDSNYRTDPSPSSTIIGGASYGGLMAYFMLTEYPEVFGGAIIMSPSFWVNDKSNKRDDKVPKMEEKYIYLSCGEKGRQIIKGTKDLNRILLKRGLAKNYRFEIEENEIHRNIAWRKMIRKSVPWVLERMNTK